MSSSRSPSMNTLYREPQLKRSPSCSPEPILELSRESVDPPPTFSKDIHRVKKRLSILNSQRFSDPDTQPLLALPAPDYNPSIQTKRTNDDSHEVHH